MVIGAAVGWSTGLTANIRDCKVAFGVNFQKSGNNGNEISRIVVLMF